jgi:hypothetical protein
MASSPQCPWHHTKQELQDILAKLKKEIEHFSLECECPHIVRAFKMFCKPLYGRCPPLILYAHDVCFVVGYDFNICVGKCLCYTNTFLKIYGPIGCILWLMLLMD